MGELYFDEVNGKLEDEWTVSDIERNTEKWVNKRRKISEREEIPITDNFEVFNDEDD